MITLNSFAFSIPGLFFGVMIAFILNLMLREIIFREAKNTLDYGLTTWSLVLGISFGFLMPFLANYLPIQQAMGKTLRNSLDLNKRQDDQIGIKVEKLENIGMSFNQFLVSIMLTVIGFGVYYFIPLAFVNENYTLALLILSGILILIVVGLTFLTTLFYTMVEKLLLWIVLNTCCIRDKRLRKVVVSNMQGHSKRNNKTSVMFTLATSFLIFASSGFSVISSLIGDVGCQFIGSDILAVSLGKGVINEGPIKRFLET